MEVRTILLLICAAVSQNRCLSCFRCITARSRILFSFVGLWKAKLLFWAALNCTPLDAAELQLIIARLDSTQDESIRGDLDRDLHLKIAQIADNPLILSVLNASAQLIENMITGIRSHFMQKNEDSPEIDSQHTHLVNAIINKNAPLAEKIMNEHMHTIERLLNEITAVHTK